MVEQYRIEEIRLWNCKLKLLVLLHSLSVVRILFVQDFDEGFPRRM